MKLMNDDNNGGLGRIENVKEDDLDNLGYNIVKKTKLRGLSPQANYTDRATAACQRG
jgi:hypothetical protein